MYLIGIDCATDARSTGLALGELSESRAKLMEVAIGSSRNAPVETAAEWIARHDVALIALDAPLGWPVALHSALTYHRAGMPLRDQPDNLFSRATDRDIRKRLGKRPLEVGADRIARTARAALQLLQELRDCTGYPIPLAWSAHEDAPLRAIEVYPAATRLSHGAPDKGGSLNGLEALLDCTDVRPLLKQSEHMRDAAVCVLAAADFISGKALPPHDLNIAQIEGWIWAPGNPTE